MEASHVLISVPLNPHLRGGRTAFMKTLSMFLVINVYALCVVAVPVILSAATPPDRQVAITIDDLPAGAANSMSAATISEMTAKLLATLRDQKISVVGFVNEKKLYKPEKLMNGSKLSACGSTTVSNLAITPSATCL